MSVPPRGGFFAKRCLKTASGRCKRHLVPQPMKRIVLLLLATLLAPPAQMQADMILTYGGALTAADPVFNRPSSASSVSDIGSAVVFNTATFTTNSFSGVYSILGDYRGPGGLSDGFLFLYTSFNPAAPLAGLVAGDDDFSISGSSPFAASFLADATSFGSAVNGNQLILNANTTYTIVLSGFANDDFGAFNVAVTAVPEPGTIAVGLGALALAAWTFRRRRGATHAG